MTVNVSAKAKLTRDLLLLTQTCFYFHWKLWPSAKSDLLQVAPETNKLPTPNLEC